MGRKGWILSDIEDAMDGGEPPEPSDISPVTIEEEMSRSYLDYAMSVIVSRALPDVRDGLKPVHRRILYSMHENGYTHDKPYRKSARVVGDVIGKYHPHGDQSIYDALVRMAQEFSMRLPLLDGQGNFGSVDGDPPAAMRYTEVRMGKPAAALLEDIDKSTVDYQANYDDTESEPQVLPARFPNLLVNGAGGIAVGMATNIPPHNLREVAKATCALIDDPSLQPEDLMAYVPGPDFPTGGIMLGRSGSRSAYMSGKGSVVVRGRVHTEEVRKEREALVITEIPYQMNKVSMIEKIAELVREKRIEGISDIRDESDRDGMRVVIELRKDAVADVVLNQLYRFSQLQSSFGCNMVALTGGRPELMRLHDFLRAFIAFREEVVTRRTKYLLSKARDRAHVLVGLAIAVTNIDEVIKLIRSAPDPATVRAELMGRSWPARDMEPLIRLIADPRHALADDGSYRLSEEQARAILDLRLQRLTALGRDEIGNELNELAVKIEEYLDILRSRARVMEIIKAELTEVEQEFGTDRRTEILDHEVDVDDEDLIQREEMVITVSHRGYIKRVPLSTYRAQRRGGKGRAGMSTRDEDFVTQLFVGNTHTPILFFSSAGMVYRMKVWKLPVGTPQAKGKALVNLLPLAEDEVITTIMPMPDDDEDLTNRQLMFATRNGTVRRNALSDFVRINRGGKIAMKLDEGDAIIGVQICSENEDVLLTSRNGRCIRFRTGEVRVFAGRNSTGVRGIKLGKDKELGDDHVISMTILRHVDTTPAEARACLKLRRNINDEQGEELEEAIDVEADAEDEGDDEVHVTQERYTELSAAEQHLLTVSVNGYGKRSSAYEYRVSGRGGKGIIAMAVTSRNGPIIASFPVDEADEIMLVTDGGQLIRCPVNDVRVAGRSTQGVTIFNTAEGERVVSVEHISEVEDEGDDADGNEPNQDQE